MQKVQRSEDAEVAERRRLDLNNFVELWPLVLNNFVELWPLVLNNFVEL